MVDNYSVSCWMLSTSSSTSVNKQSSGSFTANLSIPLISENIFKLKYPEDLKEEKRREVEKL